MNPANLIAKGSFGRHVFTLAGGTLAGQLILFITLPVLQRYFYGPEAFGIFTIYVSLSEVLIDMSSLKYDMAIVKQKRLKNKANLLFLSLFTVSVSALLIFPAMGLVYTLASDTKLVRELGYLIFLIPLSVWFFGSFNALNHWLNDKQRYRKMAAGKFINSMASEPFKIASAKPLGGLAPGLILGRIFGQAAAFFYTAYLFLKADKKVLRFGSVSEIKTLAKQERAFPMFVMPVTLITTGITYFFFQFVFNRFGNEKIGFLGPAISYIGVAVGILSSAFAQVFYKKITLIDDYSQLKKLYTKFALILFAGGIGLTAMIYLIPQAWITFILGERWAEILPISRIMVLWMVFSTVSLSLSNVHLKMGTQKSLLVLEILHFFIVLISLYGGYHYSGADFYGTLYAFAGGQIFYYLLSVGVAYYYLIQQTQKQKNNSNT